MHSGVIDTSVQPTLSKIVMYDPKNCFLMREYDSAAHGTTVLLTPL
jgi:hypothetical protein